MYRQGDYFYPRLYEPELYRPRNDNNNNSNADEVESNPLVYHGAPTENVMDVLSYFDILYKKALGYHFENETLLALDQDVPVDETEVEEQREEDGDGEDMGPELAAAAAATTERVTGEDAANGSEEVSVTDDHNDNGHNDNKDEDEDEDEEEEEEGDRFAFHKLLDDADDRLLNVEVPTCFFLFRKSNELLMFGQPDGKYLESGDIKRQRDRVCFLIASLAYFYGRRTLRAGHFRRLVRNSQLFLEERISLYHYYSALRRCLGGRALRYAVLGLVHLCPNVQLQHELLAYHLKKLGESGMARVPMRKCECGQLVLSYLVGGHREAHAEEAFGLSRRELAAAIHRRRRRYHRLIGQHRGRAWLICEQRKRRRRARLPRPSAAELALQSARPPQAYFEATRVSFRPPPLHCRPPNARRRPLRHFR